MKFFNFGPDERLTFSLGLTKIAEIFLIFVRVLWHRWSVFGSVNQTSKDTKSLTSPVDLYIYF
ncbi:uncharacterized protein METZ01_LOCUS421538, partial [marine metagenome]